MAESIVSKLAAKKLAAMQVSQLEDVPEDELLEDFIVRIHKGELNPEGRPYEKPMHLAPLLKRLNQVQHTPLRLLLSVPPRHAKSFTLLHFIVQMYTRNPKLRVAYITYGEDLSLFFSRLARDICKTAGVKLSRTVKAAGEWETEAGGLFTAVGVSGAITGRGYDVLIVDDPHKDRDEAESLVKRQRAMTLINSAVMSRTHPKSSVIVVHTRWHILDAIGQLSMNTTEGWEKINIPALNEAGEALWPEAVPASHLAKARGRNEYDWQSMYMGNPRPKGGAVFEGVVYYDELPDTKQIASAVGIDLAYTAQTHADWSVAISGKVYGDKLYITDVARKQCAATDFVSNMKRMQSALQGAPIYWYVGGVEKGVVSLLRQLGLFVHSMNAKSDKFVRAQPVGTAWNAGRVLLPRTADWLPAFLDEVLTFTGLGDEHDDQVDALAALFHPLLGKRLPRAAGTTRVSAF